MSQARLLREVKLRRPSAIKQADFMLQWARTDMGAEAGLAECVSPGGISPSSRKCARALANDHPHKVVQDEEGMAIRVSSSLCTTLDLPKLLTHLAIGTLKSLASEPGVLGVAPSLPAALCPPVKALHPSGEAALFAL